MQTSPPYANPPITEALIDIQVAASSEKTVTMLESFKTEIGTDYPTFSERLSLQGQIQGGTSVGATASQTQDGFNFISADEKQVLQVSLDQFTFNRLAPYEDWVPFRDEARRLWDIYIEISEAQSIRRVAVRYINRLDLPLPFDDLKDYLRTVPEISPNLPQGLRNYFMQVQIPQEDIEGMLILNEALVPPDNSEVISVILDIALFCDVDVPVNNNFHWDLLEKLRVQKNKVFESCITDKARELFA